VTEPGSYLAGLLVLLALDLITAAARVSLLNASFTRLLTLQEAGEAGAEHTLTLLSQPPRLRLSLNFVQTFARTGLTGLTLLLFSFQATSEGSLPALAALLLIAALIWVSEFIVEWIVLREPELWARRLTAYTRLLVLVLSPIMVLVVRLVRRPEEPGDRPGGVTADELKTLVEVGQREGVLEQDEREMIISIFRFGETLAREIMVPRIDVLALNVETPLPEAVDALLQSGYSRVPVYNETIDNIVGLLYVKDLLRAWRDGDHDAPLRQLLRPAYFVPEAKKADELLEEMQAQRVHIAIVVDEYGGMAGLVTLEDVVEEIIGEVQDEYDQAEELLFHQVGDGEYVFHGRMDLDDFNVLMGSELPADETDTLGGYIYREIGRVPKGGESLQAGDILLTIEQVLGRRIRRVRARRLPAVSETEQEPSASVNEASGTGGSLGAQMDPSGARGDSGGQ
jgi:CBS domain containing-hemolysin-like protein